MRNRRKPNQKRTGIKSAAETRAADDANARVRCNLLLFWLHCSDKRCRRVRACKGDPHACFRRHWWSRSEDERQWAREWLKALIAGKTPCEAIEAADAEAARDAALRSQGTTSWPGESREAPSSRVMSRPSTS